MLAANGTPPSSPTGLPEAPDLAAPEGPDFAQAVALADLETREENLARDALLKLNGWQKQVALWAEKHPEPALRLRQTLDVLIHVGGLYAFAQAGIIGAEMGAILGPYGSAFGAIGMMALVYGGGEAFAAGLDAGLGWLAQKAGTLGRTASEAEALVQTVKTTGEVALTAMALTGLKKGVRAVKKPATTAAIKDALSERAVVKDGKVFLGERELGAVPRRGFYEVAPIKSKDTSLVTEITSDTFKRRAKWDSKVDGSTYHIIQTDIDPHQVTALPDGSLITNLQLMKKGRAPRNARGERLELHHLGQNAAGPIVEVSEAAHRPALHKQFGYGKPHPEAPVQRSEFNKVKSSYWMERANDFTGK